MKSNKQRRQEIKAHRLRRAERQIQIRRVNARPVDRPIGTVAVTPASLRPTNSYGIPDFVQRTIKIGPFAARIAALKKSGRRRNSSGGMNRRKAMSGRWRCAAGLVANPNGREKPKRGGFIWKDWP